MNKKQYIFPLTEVVEVNLRGCLLDGSPDSTAPVPPHPGAPKRWTEVF